MLPPHGRSTKSACGFSADRQFLVPADHTDSWRPRPVFALILFPVTDINYQCPALPLFCPQLRCVNQFKIFHNILQNMPFSLKNRLHAVLRVICFLLYYAILCILFLPSAYYQMRNQTHLLPYLIPCLLSCLMSYSQICWMFCFQTCWNNNQRHDCFRCDLLHCLFLYCFWHTFSSFNVSPKTARFNEYNYLVQE